MSQLKRWLPGSWTDIVIANKAVKSDNAEVEFYPWHQRIMLLFPCAPITITSFETFAVRMWKRVRHHGVDWQTRWQAGSAHASGAKRRRVLATVRQAKNMQGGGGGGGFESGFETDWGELDRDVTKGRLVLRQILQSKWWEWSYGSALIFWRWNGAEQRAAARDGMRIYIQRQLPIGRKRMKKVKLSPVVKELVATKIEGMCKRYYLEASGHVANSLNYFAVPKGYGWYLTGRRVD